MDCLRSEDRPQLQILNVNAGYMNTGFASRALTADGQRHGVEDENQKKGYSPEYAANSIVNALVNRKTELILAPWTTTAAILLRFLFPNFMFWVLHRRGQKEIQRQKQD